MKKILKHFKNKKINYGKIFGATFLFVLSLFVVYKIQAANLFTGFAWGNDGISLADSSGAGWISFDCNDVGTCANSNYSVQHDPSTGNINGYAWSSNYGWLKFGGLSDCPFGGMDGGCNARIDSSGEVHGWARFCAGTLGGNCSSMQDNPQSGAWDGWLSLSCKNHSTSNPCAIPYGVKVDFANQSNGKASLSGFGWGNNNWLLSGPSSGVTQWISFSGITLNIDSLISTASVILEASPQNIPASPQNALVNLVYSTREIMPGTCVAKAEIFPHIPDALIDANGDGIFDETEGSVPSGFRFFGTNLLTSSTPSTLVQIKQVDPYGSAAGTITKYEITGCKDTNGVLLTKTNCPGCEFFKNVSINDLPKDLELLGNDTVVGGTTTLTWLSPNSTKFASCTSDGGRIVGVSTYSDMGNWQKTKSVTPPPDPLNNYGQQLNLTRPNVSTKFIPAGAFAGDQVEYKISCIKVTGGIQTTVSDTAIININKTGNSALYLNLKSIPSSSKTFDFATNSSNNPPLNVVKLEYDSNGINSSTDYDTCSADQTQYSLTDPTLSPNWQNYTDPINNWVNGSNLVVPSPSSYIQQKLNVQLRFPSLPPFQNIFWIKYGLTCNQGGSSKSASAIVTVYNENPVNGDFLKLEPSNYSVKTTNRNIGLSWYSLDYTVTNPTGFEYDKCMVGDDTNISSHAIYVYTPGDFANGSWQNTTGWTKGSKNIGALLSPLYFNGLQSLSVSVPGSAGQIARIYINCTNANPQRDTVTWTEVSIEKDNNGGGTGADLVLNVSPSSMNISNPSNPNLTWSSPTGKTFTYCQSEVPAGQVVYYSGTSIAVPGIPSAGVQNGVSTATNFGVTSSGWSGLTNILPLPVIATSPNKSVGLPSGLSAGDSVYYYLTCEDANGDKVSVRNSSALTIFGGLGGILNVGCDGDVNATSCEINALDEADVTWSSSNMSACYIAGSNPLNVSWGGGKLFNQSNITLSNVSSLTSISKNGSQTVNLSVPKVSTYFYIVCTGNDSNLYFGNTLITVDGKIPLLKKYKRIIEF